MTLLEIELAKLSTARLRELARSAVPTVAIAAQAEIDSRPVDPIDELRAAVFPPNPIS